MIFVTVGSMMPFDRLVAAVDAWAKTRQDQRVLVQIGDGAYVPQYCQWTRALTSEEFEARVRESTLVVAHCGMGTVLKAMEAGKPMVLLPRDSTLREVTTDHQKSAVGWLSKKPGIHIATDEDVLPGIIDEALRSVDAGAGKLSETAPREFVDRLRVLMYGGMESGRER